MVIRDEVDDVVKRLDSLEKEKESRGRRKDKRLRIRIPGVVKRGAKKGGYAALVLGSNHQAAFKKAVYKDGLIYVDGVAYSFEEASIFTLKKLPFVVVYEWRLTPVGGGTEEHGTRLLNSDDDALVADSLGIGNFGQQTIIRAIEQAGIDPSKKKLGGISPIAWLFVGVGVIYLLSKMFGG